MTSGVPPECLEKIELPEARTIIEQCIRLKKEERPSAKQLLELPFFSDFKLDLLNREILASNQETMVKFRLQVTDPEKLKKSLLKDGEAIEFDFNLESDDCMEISKNMLSKGNY